MGKIISKIGFGFLVVVMTLGIMYILMITGAFNLVPPDIPQTSAILDYSLELLSKQLMAMVPEPGEKLKVRQAFEKFRNKVYDQKVSDRDLEKVTANILNANQMDSTLSLSQVDALLDIKELPELPELEIAEAEPASEATAVVVAVNELVAEVPDSSIEVNARIEIAALNRTAQKIQKIIEFDREIKNLKNRKAIRPPGIRYAFENGLIMRVDPKLQFAIPTLESEKLREKLIELENQELLVWDEKVSNEILILKKESQKLNQEIQQMIAENPQKEQITVRQPPKIEIYAKISRRKIDSLKRAAPKIDIQFKTGPPGSDKKDSIQTTNY